MKFTSKVIHGRKHGRAIGYPTANLEVAEAAKQVLDKEGVYAVQVAVGDKKYGGALFYGHRSLFKDSRQVCEILLLDFTDDIYEQEIIVDVIKYLRETIDVKDEMELKNIIEADVKNARLIIKRYKTQDTNNTQ